MDLELKNKIAFVAGASQGMGAAVAKCLSEEGAIVFVCARNLEKIEAVATHIESKTGNRVIPLVCDVRDEDSVMEEDGYVDLVAFGKFRIHRVCVPSSCAEMTIEDTHDVVVRHGLPHIDPTRVSLSA